MLVGGKAGEAGGDVGPGARRQPVDGSHNALVHLCTACQVWVVWVGGGKGIDGEAGAIGGHVRNPFHPVYPKTVGCVFGERGLGEMDGDVAVV